MINTTDITKPRTFCPICELYSLTFIPVLKIGDEVPVTETNYYCSMCKKVITLDAFSAVIAVENIPYKPIRAGRRPHVNPFAHRSTPVLKPLPAFLIRRRNLNGG